jgi:SAM-dependent methyltransferase
MKNILNEIPKSKLSGRLLASILFCDKEDIANKTVLDIGCGFGWFELFAISVGTKKIIGTELSDADLKTAKSNIRTNKASFKEGSALNIPFKKNSFDTVVLWEVIEHLPKFSEPVMLKEVFRVLKPGGKLYISTPYSSLFSKLLDPAWWLIGHRHYSAHNLHELASEHGFSLEKVGVFGGWWTTLGILNMYISKWILKRTMLFNNLFSSKTTEEYISGSNGFSNIFVRLRKV